MTDHELRDLLQSHADEITLERDLATPAWRSGRRARRRRAGLTAGAAALAVVAVVGGVAVVDRPADPTTPATRPSPRPWQPPSESSDAGPAPAPDSTRPDARIGDTRVYLAPSAEDPAALPAQTAGRPPLPDTVDLDAEATSVADAPIRYAEGALAVRGPDAEPRVLLIAPDGTLRALDLAGLAPYEPSGGADAVALPVSDSMLSPTGEYLAFPQVGGIAVYDVRRDTWSSFPLPRGTGFAPTLGWLGDTDLWLRSGTEGPLVDVGTGQRTGGGSLDPAGDARRALPRPAAAYGRYRSGPYGTAQSFVLDETPPSLTTAEVFLGQRPDLVVAASGDPDGADALLVGDGVGPEGGFAACCQVASWGSGEGAGKGVLTYVWAPPGAGAAYLLSWTVGTHRVERVMEVTGVPEDGLLVTSWARFWD